MARPDPLNRRPPPPLVPFSRRQMLVGAALVGGLLLAWEIWPRHYPGALVPGPGEHVFGAWLTIGEDGVVTVAIPQLEMGQGVSTILAQVVAHELGADWRQVAIQPVPPNAAQPNAVLAAKWAPMWSTLPAIVSAHDSRLARNFAVETPFAGTADGTSLSAYEEPARMAGAAARALLAKAAAERWGVEWEACEVRGGLVRHGTQQAPFGALAAEAARLSPPDPVALRTDPAREVPLDESETLALVYPRIDLPAKVDGSAQFAGDVRLPGMLHAAIRFGPLGVHDLAGFDKEAARAMPGVRAVVHGTRWLAAVADNWWQAERALDALRPRFRGGAPVDTGQVATWLREAVKDEGRPVTGHGDAAGAFKSGEGVYAATYSAAAGVHASIETASATARFADGRLELWIATQMPGLTRASAAKSLGMPERDVVIYPMPAGGSFDARLESRHAAQVARIAKALGRPVQLTWSRAEELRAHPVRTPVAVGLTARLDAATTLPVAWRARVACPATMLEFGHRNFDRVSPGAAMQWAKGKTDPLACEGAVPPYGIAAVAVEHCPVTVPTPTTRLRGNATAYTAFATESFIDELARRAGRDPLVYRLGMLSGQPRLAAVLQRAARLGEWDGGRAGRGQGIALLRMDAFGVDARAGGGRIACVAVARMGERGVAVERLTAVVDIGRIVNLDIARQQIEGGLLFGVGTAMGGSVDFVRGMPQPASLAGLNLPILATAPEIVVEFIASDAPPFDPGELGAAVAPPAIANALFAATGLRYRSLPLREGTAP